MQKNRLPLIALACMLLIGLGCAGLAAAQVWRASQLMGALRPQVKLASLHTDRMLDLEGAGTPVMPKEYFDKASESVNEIDKAIIAVRGASEHPQRRPTSVAIEYMGAAQSAIRALAHLKHKVLETQAATEARRQNQQESNASDALTRDVAILQAPTYTQKVSSALQNQIKAREAVLASVEALQKQLAATATAFGADTVVNSARIDALVRVMK